MGMRVVGDGIRGCAIFELGSRGRRSGLPSLGPLTSVRVGATRQLRPPDSVDV